MPDDERLGADIFQDFPQGFGPAIPNTVGMLSVVDEPTGNLDPMASEAILQVLQQVNFGGTSVLLATHETALVESMSYRTISINDGTIVS